jgi:hypothetical protein
MRPDACIATLPTGKCRFLLLPNDTFLAWYANGDAQIWNTDGLIVKKLQEGTDQPITDAALIDDKRFWTTTHHDIKIYTLAGDVVGHISSDDPLRSVYFEGDRVIAVSARQVSISSLMGEPLARAKSDEDMGYDFGRFYPPDHLILFKTLNRQSNDEIIHSLMDDSETGESYEADLLTSDLKTRVATAALPHKRQLTRVFIYDQTMFTLSDDCMRVWAPGLRLMEGVLHADGNFAKEVFQISADDYLSHDSSVIILHSTKGGELNVKKGWNVGYIPSFHLITPRKVLVGGGNSVVALIDIGEPFGVNLIQDMVEPTRSDAANVAGEVTFLQKAGRIVAYDSDGGIALWDVNGKSVSERRRYGSRWWEGARELPDGRILLWASDCVFLILSPDGEVDGHIIDRFRTKEGVLGLVENVGIFPNGRIAVSIKGIVSLLEPKGVSTAPPAYGHDFGILDVIALKNGEFVTAGVDDLLIYWDKQAVARWGFEGHEDCVNGVLEMPGGEIVSWSDDGTVRVWRRDGRPARAPILVHRKPILRAKMLDDDHLVASDGTTLFFLSLSTQRNPQSVQRYHNQMLAGFTILRSGNIISWDEDGRMFEWNPLKSRCKELRCKGFCAVEAWESGDGGLIVIGLTMSLSELSLLPPPVAVEKTGQLPTFVVAWSAGDLGKRQSTVLFKGQLRNWTNLGHGRLLVVLPDGEADLLDFDGTALRVVSKVPGALGTYALPDGRPFLYTGSGGYAGHIIANTDDPMDERLIVAGRGDPKFGDNIVLDGETGAATRIRSVGAANDVAEIPGGGWAALYRRDGEVKTFYSDGTPRSQHRYIGDVQFFGKREDGNVTLLTFHHGQLLVYDLAVGQHAAAHPGRPPSGGPG